MKACPNCKSTDVQVGYLAWFAANADDFDLIEIDYSAEPARYYCRACNKYTTPFVETEE